MAALPPRHRWLLELTQLPTASGREQAVIAWVERWVARRSDLRLRRDAAGNLLITIKGRRRRDPVIATAHLDHPAFVVEEVDGRMVTAEFRGGVIDAYFDNAPVEVIDDDGVRHPARVRHHDRHSGAAALELNRLAPLRRGAIGRWRFPAARLGVSRGLLRAPACDDLAGAAAALTALDRARRSPALRHLGVLLTRAEEVGFVGAIAAAKLATIPERSRVLSIETSRSFADSPIGDGPVVRVGDRSSIFDADLTNRIADIMRAEAIPHQRKLMDGGTCEATAFAAYGYRATGLCLPLGNYHNMVDIDGVLAGKRPAVVGPEIVSLSDYDGLVELILAAARHLDREGPSLVTRLDERYAETRHLLD